ncbi:hypothetical protein [Arthrobacter woluwensis]|uniref:hypothetical protein n=1 Tax=Arthrobacter woluwensis TaxID=156980 RepID=UPI0037FDE728
MAQNNDGGLRLTGDVVEWLIIAGVLVLFVASGAAAAVFERFWPPASEFLLKANVLTTESPILALGAHGGHPVGLDLARLVIAVLAVLLGLVGLIAMMSSRMRQRRAGGEERD